jgi:YbbR domain-containing protein
MNNIFYKIISFLFAFLFWFFVQGEEQVEINRKIQITILPADGYILRGTSIRYKDATLYGSRSLLSKFSSGPIIANIKTPKNSLGKFRLRIDKEHITDWNPKIKLTIHDAYLNLFIDEKNTKTLPVKELIRGTPQDGFFIEKILIEPKDLFITGLKTELFTMKEIQTKLIDVSGWSKTQTISSQVIIPPHLSSSTKISKDFVKITIRIAEKKDNKINLYESDTKNEQKK